MVQSELGPDYDVGTHFTPRYKPWDQRLCLVPDADLFVAIREGRASVVTDTIDTFTETGINLASGTEIAADIVVTETGLEMQSLSDVAFTIDRVPTDIARTSHSKGMIFSDVSNIAT